MDEQNITHLEYLRLIQAPTKLRFSVYLHDHPDFPHVRHNERRYDIPVSDLIVWLHDQKKVEIEQDENSFEYQKLRKLTLEADALERTKLVDEDVLRDTHQIIKDVTTEYARVRSKLSALPSRLSNRLVKKTVGQIEKQLDREIHDLLEELSTHE